ncbi:peptide deformylase [Brachybacterium sp. FME24]|uniref:peptide deformylase n=1 Tax=Brachybacterium sp. FME24 TaxID=2742605 RepID=UPI0018688573|nr:peptide deformylase [Brachybacterium sp. FME24]
MDTNELTRKILDRRAKEGDPLRIVQSGHPALRRTAVSAHGRLRTELLLELVDAMTLTMRDAPGVGLAAPQIGLPLSLYVIEDRAGSEPDPQPDEPTSEDAGEDGDDDGDDDLLERSPVPLRALMDSQIELLGTQRVYAWEGCLSVDGWQSIVPRSRRVRLRATELLPGGELREVDEEHVGWPARILQHETDHLDGTLCHDLMVPRSFIEGGYTVHYSDLSEAVRRLGLSGEIATLGEGEIIAG